MKYQVFFIFEAMRAGQQCIFSPLLSSFLSLLAVASQQGEGAAVVVKVIYV